MTLPLEGTKVIDLSRFAPGLYCTMLLGDLGADVLKVDEPPRAGESPERAGVLSAKVEGERRATYVTLNRNKKSIVLNLKSEAARGILYKLVEGADVVVEGFRPGVMKRLGADYEALRGINPRLVYCSISGYGQDGPYKGLVGHDINYISIAGALGLIGLKGERPAIPMNILADYAAGGLYPAFAILAALMARDRTGRGQYIDMAMTDGVVSLLAGIASIYSVTGEVFKRGETRLNGAAPYYNVYETKDGEYISIGCVEPYFWENLCRVLGREDFVPHQDAEGEKQEEIFSTLRDIFRTKNRDEWFQLLSEADVCAGPIYSVDEIFQDPQLLHRGMVVEVDDPMVGKVKQVGIPVKLSETPGSIRNPAPRTAEHTDETLQGLGYTTEQIGELRSTGAVY